MLLDRFININIIDINHFYVSVYNINLFFDYNFKMLKFIKL